MLIETNHLSAVVDKMPELPLTGCGTTSKSTQICYWWNQWCCQRSHLKTKHLMFAPPSADRRTANIRPEHRYAKWVLANTNLVHLLHYSFGNDGVKPPHWSKCQTSSATSKTMLHFLERNCVTEWAIKVTQNLLVCLKSGNYMNNKFTGCWPTEILTLCHTMKVFTL